MIKSLAGGDSLQCIRAWKHSAAHLLQRKMLTSVKSAVTHKHFEELPRKAENNRQVLCSVYSSTPNLTEYKLPQ